MEWTKWLHIDLTKSNDSECYQCHGRHIHRDSNKQWNVYGNSDNLSSYHSNVYTPNRCNGK